MKHIYYRIRFRFLSPLSIGNGETTYSDHDILRRKSGKPFLPASAIAGVFRHYYDGDEALQRSLFGSISDKESVKSRIIFYDADIRTDYCVTVRDCVRLRDKVGEDGGKFDLEAVESDTEFVTMLELSDESAEQYVRELLAALSAGEFRFGYKTTRGFGITKVTEIRRAAFDTTIANELEEWLSFSPFQDTDWQNQPIFVSEAVGGRLHIQLKLRQTGAVSIRVYSTEVYEEGNSAPDYHHITLNNGTPVIPGTSWAGAFRDRYRQLAGDQKTDELFGFVAQQKSEVQCRRSVIRFSESAITGGTWKNITRNSIDRFTAATKDAALYTERTCYGGTTELELVLPREISSEQRFLLGAVILDLHHGLLSVGGLTAVGRGLFTVESVCVNQQERTQYLNPDGIARLLEVN